MFACFSCKEEQIERNLISQSELVEILSEMELAKAAITFQKTDEKAKNEDVFNVIWKNYDTDKGQFERTLQYYSQRPKEMENIYNEVISVLSEKQAKLN